MNCEYCKFPIESGTFIGAGDGTGQKFAHEACYYRKMQDEMKMKLDTAIHERDVFLKELTGKHGMIGIRTCYYCKDEYPEWGVVSAMVCPKCKYEKRTEEMKHALKEINGIFFWRQSPDKYDNHQISHTEVKQILKLTDPFSR